MAHGKRLRSLLPCFLLAALLPAQTQSGPKLEGGYPGADGGGCSSSQWAGRLGAGTSVLPKLELDFAHVLLAYEAAFSVPPAPPPMQHIPSAGDDEGSVDSAGNLLVHVDLIDPPPISGYPFDFGLVYRSNRPYPSAAEGLHRDWNFVFLDQATLVFDGGALVAIEWQSGTGDRRTATVQSPPGPNLGTWLRAIDGFSWFRYWQDGSTWRLDRHRPDGSVMRYEPSGSTNVWRPNTFFDPHDNAYTYLYEPSGHLRQVTDPRGIETRFVWGQGTLSVQHWTGTGHVAALDEQLGLQDGRITWLQLPATTYLQPGSNGLHDESSPTTDQRQFPFTYGSHGGQWLLTDIDDSRTGGSLLHVAYEQRLGQYRVVQQTDMHAGVHTFTYDTAANQRLLLTYYDPLDNRYAFEVADDGIPRVYTVTPAAVGGRPRAAAGDTPEEEESLTWEFDASPCGCGLITWVKYPSGREYSLGYDGLGNLTSWTTLSPTGTGNQTWSWQYHPLAFGGRIEGHQPPGAPSTTARLDWSYAFLPRGHGLYGNKPVQITVTSSPVSTLSGSQVLSTQVDLDLQGRPLSVRDAGDTWFDYVYAAASPGQGLLQRIERRAVGSLGTQKLVLTADDLGRVTQAAFGTDGKLATTVFGIDALGRPQSATVQPGSGQPAIVTLYDRDAFEQVALVRRNNLDFDGQGPKYDDGSGSPRAWVRSEFHHYYDRLVDAYVDRRALPEPEVPLDPTGGANPWLLHTRFEHDLGGRVEAVVLPNGSTTRYVYDGYGTLYRAIADQGSQQGDLNLELGRRYFDLDLVPWQFRRQVKVAGALAWATTSFQRNHGGKGFVDQVTWPDGSYVRYTYDVVARTTQVQAYDQGHVRRQYQQWILDQLGRTTSALRYLLDGNGVVQAAPVQTDYLYDLRSQVTEVRAPLGRKGFWQYDAYGRLQKVHDNLSSQPGERNEVALEYVTGRDLVAAVVASVFDEDGQGSGVQRHYRTEYEHDLLGRVVTTRQKGLVGGSAAPRIWTYAYHSLGMLARLQEPQQQGSSDQYSRTVFDAAGRWVQFVKSGGTSGKIVLGAEYRDVLANSKKSEVLQRDGRGFVTRSEYDAASRLVNLYRPGYTAGQAHRTAVEYDVASLVERVTDGNGSVVLYARDLMGRVLERQVTPGFWVSQLATKEAFAYGPLGRLSRMETAMGSGGALLLAAVDFDQDSLGRRLQERFSYFGTGGTVFPVVSSYDIANGPDHGDPSMRRQLTYPGQLQVELQPDALGRLQQVGLSGPGLPAFELARYWHGGGQVLGRELNLGSSGPQVETTAGFDDFRRLQALQHQIGSSSPIEQFAYSWNAAGDLIRKKRQYSGTTSGQLFRHDPFHRLTGAKLGVPMPDADGSYEAASFAQEITYGLDPGQNRSSVTVQLAGQTPATTAYATEANSPRYAQVGAVAPIHDGEGNLVFDGQYYYVYDFRNRLAEVYVVADVYAELEGQRSPARARLSPATAQRVREPDLRSGRQQLWNRAGGNLPAHAQQHWRAPGALSVRVTPIPATGSGSLATSGAGADFSLTLLAYYGYDPWNRRVLRHQNGQDLRSVYDGWREVEELVVSAGAVVGRQAFVWGAGFAELLAVQQQGSGGWTGYYPLQDEQGSVVRLLDGSGATVERVDYEPYGRARYFWGGGEKTVSQVGNPWTYAGGRRDEETGLVYLRNRYLQVEWGRFCTVDPLGEWGDGANLGNGYGYVGNGPMALVDPLGLLTGPPDGPQGPGSALQGPPSAQGAGSGNSQAQPGDNMGAGVGAALFVPASRIAFATAPAGASAGAAATGPAPATAPVAGGLAATGGFLLAGGATNAAFVASIPAFSPTIGWWYGRREMDPEWRRIQEVEWEEREARSSTQEIEGGPKKPGSTPESPSQPAQPHPRRGSRPESARNPLQEVCEKIYDDDYEGCESIQDSWLRSQCHKEILVKYRRCLQGANELNPDRKGACIR